MNANRNWTHLAVAAIVRMFMLGTAGVSFSHIIATSHALGLSWEAWTVPFLVDGLAVLGMIGRSHRFAAATQRAGLRLMAGAGLLSLACNVYAGHNLGQRLYGVLIVAGFVVSEWYACKLRPAPVATDELAEAKRAVRSEAARKGAETKARRRAEREAAERAETRRIRKAAREMERAELVPAA